MAAQRKFFLEKRRGSVSSRRTRSKPARRSAMMRNPLSKTIRFISSISAMSGGDATHGLPCHTRNPSILLRKMTLAVGIGNASHRRSQQGPYVLE